MKHSSQPSGCSRARRESVSDDPRSAKSCFRSRTWIRPSRSRIQDNGRVMVDYGTRGARCDRPCGMVAFSPPTGSAPLLFTQLPLPFLWTSVNTSFIGT